MGNNVSIIENRLGRFSHPIKCTVCSDIYFLLVGHRWKVNSSYIAYGIKDRWGVIFYPNLDISTQSNNFIPKYNELSSQIKL